MAKTFGLRRLAIAVVVGLLSVGVWNVGESVLVPEAPLPPVAAPAQPPELPNKPVVVTSQADVEQTFGPFERILVSPSTQTPDTHYPSILLLRADGSTEASTAWTVPFDPDQWDEQRSLQITGTNPDLGYVVIRTSTGVIYTVKAGQVFFIEGVPEYAFATDAQGNVFSVITSRAAGMRKAL